MLFDASVRLVSANCMSLWFVFLTTLIGKTKEQEIKEKKKTPWDCMWSEVLKPWIGSRVDAVTDEHCGGPASGDGDGVLKPDCLCLSPGLFWG